MTTRPELASGRIHVWADDLESVSLPAPEVWLSAQERARAARYRRPLDRRRFERRRAWLRWILGEYLGVDPARVRLHDGAYGKPAVADCDELQFSVSHAEGRALCAVASGRRVGVDLARACAETGDDAVARAFFAPAEIAGLQALPREARARAFPRCWTRKEAYVKARGEGLHLPLDAFEVSLAPATWTSLVRCAFDVRELARWAFLLLEPFAGHVASIAIEVGDPCELSA